MAVRADAIEGQPFLMSPVLMASDVRIYMNRPLDHPLNVDVTDALKNVTKETYIYFVIIIIVALTLLAGFALESKGSELTVEAAVKKACQVVWDITGLLVDQENVHIVSRAQQVLWVFLNFIMFITIFGYLLNLMSVDLVTFQEAPNIDSIDDHFSENFKHVDPGIFHDFNSYEYFRSSPSGSLPARLLERVNKTNSFIIFPGGLQEFTLVLGEKFDPFFNRSLSLIFEEVF